MSKHKNKGWPPAMNIEKHCVGVMKRGGPDTEETTGTRMQTPIGLIGEAIMLACGRGGDAWKVESLVQQAIELEADQKAVGLATLTASRVRRLVRKLGDERTARALDVVEDYFDSITSEKELNRALNGMVVIDESDIAGG